MVQRKDWSEDQVLEIFETLGLKIQERKDPVPPKSVEQKPQPSNKPIYLPRLSSSSVPPPTGRTKNAKLENSSKRS